MLMIMTTWLLVLGDDWRTGPYGFLALLIIPAAILFLAFTHRKKHICGPSKKGELYATFRTAHFCIHNALQ